MKIETNIILDFLKKIRMQEIETCLLEFTDEGLKVSVLSVANTHRVDALLYKKNFTDYAPIGILGVDSLSTLLKVFNRLGKEIDFDVDGNLLIAKGNKKELKFELVDEKFIEKTKEMPSLEHASTVNMNVKTLIDCIDDATLNKNSTIIFETVDNGLKISNDGKYRFTRNIDSEGTKGGHIVKFGHPLVAIFNDWTKEDRKNIKDGMIEMRIKNDYPLIITLNSDVYNMKYLVAPRVENN